METTKVKYAATWEINEVRKEIAALDTMRDNMFSPKQNMLRNNLEITNIFMDPKNGLFESWSVFVTKLNGIYKAALKKEEELLSRCPAKYWGNSSKTGEYGTFWILFPTTMTDEEIRDYLENFCNIDWEGRSINSAYDCTGKMFTYHVELIRRKNRVLVTQHWGIDC